MWRCYFSSIKNVQFLSSLISMNHNGGQKAFGSCILLRQCECSMHFLITLILVESIRKFRSQTDDLLPYFYLLHRKGLKNLMFTKTRSLLVEHFQLLVALFPFLPFYFAVHFFILWFAKCFELFCPLVVSLR